MKKYSKLSLSHKEQISLLKNRGMKFKDVDLALFNLKHISYYRLRAYWEQFELDSNNHIFREDTYFEDVVSLYNFDRELRLIIMDAIERIEVSVRAHWSHLLGQIYGSHAHLDSKLFST